MDEPFARPPLPSRSSGAGSLVLVVEDDPPNRALLTQLLERDGYRVIAVADGEAAVHSVAEHAPTWSCSTWEVRGSTGTR